MDFTRPQTWLELYNAPPGIVTTHTSRLEVACSRHWSRPFLFSFSLVLLYDNNVGGQQEPIDVANSFKERLDKGKMFTQYAHDLHPENGPEFVKEIVNSRANLGII
jgi:hypothetical protein